jgi:thioredoxin-dependent peroxiredoxin
MFRNSFQWKQFGGWGVCFALMPVVLCAQEPAAKTGEVKISVAEANEPEVGKPAPDFAMKDQNGKTHRLADYKGKTVVLAFYPKDDTPGCTAQMCGLRNALPQFKEKNVVVLGVSVQDTASKKAFAEKYGLTFPVLADTEKSVAKAYGVLGANGVAERVTFVIGADGTLQNVDRAARLARQDGKVMSDHAAALALMLSDDWKAEVGKPVPSFTLKNHDGKPIISTSSQADVTVLAFVSTKCSFSNDYNGRLTAFAREYAERNGKKVRVLAINSNAGEKPDAIAKHAKDNDFPYPVVKDEGNVIADRFRAEKTPEIWVMDRRGVIRYHGAIDDHYDAAQVKTHYLVDAVNALLEGKEPPVTETLPQGCTIKRERKR